MDRRRWSGIAVALLVASCGLAATGGLAAGVGLDAPKAAAAQATVPVGTPFQVHGAGAIFNASLPPSSIATYTWVPGAAGVQEWLSTPNGSTVNNTQLTVAVGGAAAPGALDITVNPAAQHQKMQGFGAAMTDSAAYLIKNSSQRSTIMSQLFGSGPADAHFNIIRVPMGATDLINTPYASYDDSVQPDLTLSKFSIAHDQTNTIPLLQQAKQLQPGLNLIGTPWSAPAWMKVDNTFNGSCGVVSNSLNGLDYGVYAQYFVKFVQAYAAAGLPVATVSLQNEPENCNSTYPTMNLTAANEATLSSTLRAALNGAGLASVKILGWDHNWYSDGATTPSTFAQTLLNTPGEAVDTIGYHCYSLGNNPNAFMTQETQVPSMMTECTGLTKYTDVATNLVSEVRNALLGPIRAGATSSLYWSLAQNTDGSPHIGGCPDCRGLFTMNAAGGPTPSQDLYYWEHFSRYVSPGDVRIDSTSHGLGSIETVTFQNPSTGAVTLVALNSAMTPSYVGHIVQWDGDTKTQKTAWLVGPDGQRRWINNTATYNCLKNKGAPGPNIVSSFVLDELPDLTNVWAVCGVDRIGVNSMLQAGFYARSQNAANTLRLTTSNLALTDSNGHTLWSTGRGGDDLILQSDGNLVEYAGTTAVWASNTVGSGAAWLVVGNDGKLSLYNAAGSYVWTNEGPPSNYVGHIVQWSGDTNTQKTAWLVGPDGQRRWINNAATYNCLKASGARGPDVLTSWELGQIPDLTNVWAVCGVDRIGVNSMLQPGFYARSQNGSTTLRLTGSNLTLTNAAGTTLWSTGTGGSELILQSDGNLVEYSGSAAVWASNTVGSGAAWLVVGNDGKLSLYNAAGNYVWTSEGTPASYTGHIVQWEGDTKTQKTAWLVGPDGRRRWIPDAATYNCLKSKGTPGPDVLTSWELNQIPDLTGVWASCP